MVVFVLKMNAVFAPLEYWCNVEYRKTHSKTGTFGTLGKIVSKSAVV